MRCDRRLRNPDSVQGHAWNIVVESGYITGLICPACQSGEENIEAEINHATLDYGLDGLGRLVGRPKGDGTAHRSLEAPW
ncbi:hypothetical protein [Mycobacterium sp. NPDC050853]|uniref:hypothetical protein n=1 Tax=Mycobacterium sp. NPDC050853 TaxID=3155160 RepID=UPI0033F9D2BB